MKVELPLLAVLATAALSMSCNEQQRAQVARQQLPLTAPGASSVCRVSAYVTGKADATAAFKDAIDKIALCYGDLGIFP